MRPERQQSPVLSSLELTLVFAELCKFFRTRNGNFPIFRSFFKEKQISLFFEKRPAKHEQLGHFEEFPYFSGKRPCLQEDFLWQFYRAQNIVSS